MSQANKVKCSSNNALAREEQFVQKKFFVC